MIRVGIRSDNRSTKCHLQIPIGRWPLILMDTKLGAGSP